MTSSITADPGDLAAATEPGRPGRALGRPAVARQWPSRRPARRCRPAVGRQGPRGRHAAAHEPGHRRGGARLRRTAWRPCPGPTWRSRSRAACRRRPWSRRSDDAVSGRVVDILGGRTFRLYRNRDLVGRGAGRRAQEHRGHRGRCRRRARGRGQRQGRHHDARPGRDDAPRRGHGCQPADLRRPGRHRRHPGHLLVGRCRATTAWAWSWPPGAAGRRSRARLPGVAEGAYTVRAAVALAERHGVDMPIAREVHAVLYEGKDVRASRGRPARPRLEGRAGGPRLIDSGLRRGVAQPGSALDWGSRGRWFESSRPDHYSERETALGHVSLGLSARGAWADVWARPT